MASVYAALAAVMADVASVRKGDRNEQQGFSFRGIDAVVNAVGPALRKHKVIVTPEVRTYEYGTVEVGRNRTQMGHVRVLVAYTFHGPEGDSITAVAPGEAMDAGDKATAKAMSVAFRTALLQALALPTDEPDPDSTVYERSAAPPSQQEQSAAAQALADLSLRMKTVEDLRTAVYEQARAGHLFNNTVTDPVTGESVLLSVVIATAKARLVQQATEGDAA